MLNRCIFYLPVPNVSSHQALIKTSPCLQEGDSSKRVQTFVVLVLSFRSSSSSSCSVRRWRLLSITVKKQHVKIIIGLGFIKLKISVLCVNKTCCYSLSGGQQVLFLIFLDARTSWFHLQGRGGGLLCSWLDKMSKQLCLLQQVLKSVGPVCLLHTHKHACKKGLLTYLSNNRVVGHAM